MTRDHKPHHVIHFTLACMLLIVVLVYFLTLDRTASFSTEIDSTLPPDVLWSYIETSFEEPALTPIWPKDIIHITPVTLSKGGLFSVTYDMLISRTTIDYKITSYEPGHILVYRTTKDRGVNGTIVIEVLERDGGSMLRRNGYYHYRIPFLLLNAVSLYHDY